MAIVLSASQLPAVDLINLAAYKNEQNRYIIPIDAIDSLNVTKRLSELLKAHQLECYILPTQDGDEPLDMCYTEDLREAWDSLDFSSDSDENNNCLEGMKCPECGEQSAFKLLVRGADPDDVDLMESQTRIMRRLEEGDLEIVDFEITMYDDGSDETVSDTEWLGPCECVHCGWVGNTDEARTLHDE